MMPLSQFLKLYIEHCNPWQNLAWYLPYFSFFFFYAVLEYVEGNGTCNISETQGVDETTARRYFKDILAGIIYLHNHVSPFKNFMFVCYKFGNDQFCSSIFMSYLNFPYLFHFICDRMLCMEI